jgi:alpha-1,2-mannosyltransferase
VQQANTIARPAPRRPVLRLRHGRLLLRAATVAVVAVSLWMFVVAPLTGHFTGLFEDFRAYIGAARDMAAGHSPYHSFDGSASVVMTGFDYPPFAAVLVRPLALLSDQAAMTTWLLMSLGCTVAGALVVVRTALPASWPRTELALLGALAFSPVTYNYWHGQMNPVIFLLLALAFRSWVRGRELSTGVLLGLAAGIKLAPVVLIVLLLRRRWWRGTAAMALTGLATVAVAALALGTGPVRAFVTDVLPSLTRETGWIYNQSLSALLSRAADHSVLAIQPALPVLHDLSLLGSAVLLGVVAWAVRPGRRDPAERGAEFGAAVTAMLLAGTIAWFPHFTHLLIPLAAAAGLVAARGWRVERGLLAGLVAVLLVFGVVAPLVISSIDMASLRALQAGPSWWVALQAFSLPALSALALLVVTVRSLRRRGPSRIAAPAAA